MIPEQMIQSVLFNESKNIQRSKSPEHMTLMSQFSVWPVQFDSLTNDSYELVLFSEKQIPSADSQMNDSCDSGLFIEFIKYVGAQHSNVLLIKLSA